MKTTTTKEVRAAATDQSWQAPDNAASEIINMRLDDSGFGWVNDRGFEPMIPKNTHSALINNTVDDYSRTFVWERHRSSELYVISKRGSELSYEVANNSGLTPTNWKPLHRIGYNRTVAKIDDPDEQYIPFGRLCIIINGKDPMLKFFGRDRVEPFGFTQLTPRPQVLGPDPEYFKGTCTLATPVSTYPYNANDTIGGISFGPGSASGLGNKTDDSTSTYRYKVSFITDTGSESPLSDYEQVSWFNVNDGLTYAVFFQLLPIGPPGTVARRIYRTKNMGTLRGDLVNDTYYFVDQIDDNISKNYYDTKGDQVLVVEAPAQTASDVINNALKYGASWDGRVWLAGGAGTETKIIYSRQGLPEQFPTFSYFDVGNRKGGAITGLIPYYDNLLIFRETSIEVIRSSGSGYICTTLNSNIGTTATNTITVVQGEGVFFLSYDGVYAFKGGVLGGSQLSVVRISDTIQIELNRISRGALAKASASYSFKEKEWWVIYPVDGETENSRGCVYHVQAGGWSFRNANGIDDNLFQFNDITTLPSGNFLFSPRRRIQPNVPIFGEALIDPSGLVVWSGKRSGGDILQYSLNELPIITSTSIKGPLLSTWQSAWFDFGDDSPIKRILSVEVEILTKGHNEIELLSATDYRDDNVISGSRPTVVATIYGTPNEDSLYTPATGSFDKSPAIIGTSRWGEQKPARLRWDVNTGLVSWYRFTLRSTNLFQVVAFNIKYTISDNATPNIRAGERKTI